MFHFQLRAQPQKNLLFQSNARTLAVFSDYTFSLEIQPADLDFNGFQTFVNKFD